MIGCMVGSFNRLANGWARLEGALDKGLTRVDDEQAGWRMDSRLAIGWLDRKTLDGA